MTDPREWPPGGSEMGLLVRAHDRAHTPLGIPESWPAALRIAATTALDSALPAIVLWGADLIQIYNDGYRAILGLRHPLALGQQTRACWPEVWGFNEPIYRRVMETGERVYLEDQEYVIEPSGVPETRYFTLSFAPARDELGAVGGVLVVVLETTRRVLAERQNTSLLQASEVEADRLRLMFAQAPSFMALLKGPEHVFQVVNAAYMRLLGDRQVIGQAVRQAIPEIEDQGFLELLDSVYAKGEPFLASGTPILLPDAADSPASLHYLNFVYQPIKDAHGQVTGIFVAGSDITPQYNAQQALVGLNEELTGKVSLLEAAGRRHAFQLELAHRIRPLTLADDVIAAACELLGRHLKVSRVLFCEVDDVLGTLVIRNDWTRNGVASLAGQTRALNDFGPLDIEALRAGELVARDDITQHSRSAAYAQAYARIGIRATLAIPLVKAGRLSVIFNLHQVEPHHWSDTDIQLAQDVAEWTWSAAESARAQAELRTERDQSQHTFDHMAEGFSIIDRDWCVTQMNAVGLLLGRRTAAQVIGKNYWDVWPEARHTSLEKFYRRVMETGKSEKFEQQIHFSDGHISWLELRAQRILDSSIAVFFRDTTQEKLDKAALRLTQTRADAALRVAQLGTFTWDSDTNDAECSERTREIFGFTPDQGHVADDYFNCIVAADLAPVQARLASTLARDGRIDIEYRIQLPDGQVRHIVCQGDSRRGLDGKWERFVGVFHDVSKSRQAEILLRTTDRRKDEFLAMLAHELRNPLAPIVTAARILSRPGVDAATISQASGIIERQAAHMTGLLADLLDVSRIDKGLVTLDKKVLNLSEIVRQAVEQVQPLMVQRRHRLSVHTPQEGMRVEGDHVRLVQILSNILVNAAKYTPEAGDITLELTRTAEHAVMTVRDNGVGIGEDLLPGIFDIFTQAERSVDRHQGGLGLGLTLVMHLVALLGGRVTAKSAGLGKGSEFSVYLPLFNDARGMAEPSAAPASLAPGQSRRILLVDDNVDAASTIAMLLSAEGHVVSVAHNGPDALKSARLEPPQIVLLDIGLPVMDGYSVARQLKASQGTAEVLLVALTGYGQPEDRARSLAAGFDHHLVKPVDSAELLDLIDSAVLA
jgi:PAS domain S-box-containing protein